ncbi:MAG TPA: 16S rRNA (guanine(527)-N(7))-methyltransferase RsmG [Segeticoccus sp.]|uniref:16S rRNA (guanine(527)-N(7))-methyltransferase RsmG n=1 Tax=Segeticoccus sp. TaxID=2706531 RepID=UPI002D7F4109|nr:16S rRNA (guanine(527)-N(7))-methyltransferase RsmG [Segeticoccus sp.]HET8600880.1 16S rRNA (guanine(527)-N(7))-methyltransferase RsmG [Segeticoccus sp.]
MAATHVFGGQLACAEQFVSLLCSSGVTHGLIGPREVPRIWDRHVLNCAVVGSLLPAQGEVIDVGAGAGLPGLALAIARPDCRVHLVEPMLRRTTWLQDAVERLELPNALVHRGRAEELWDALSAPVVTSRAVARLAQLSRWSLPLLRPHGQMLAIKGSSARTELAEDAAELRRLGAVATGVLEVGAPEVDPPTTVVRVRLGDRPAKRVGAKGPAVRRRTSAGTRDGRAKTAPTSVGSASAGSSAAAGSSSESENASRTRRGRSSDRRAPAQGTPRRRRG